MQVWLEILEEGGSSSTSSPVRRPFLFFQGIEYSDIAYSFRSTVSLSGELHLGDASLKRRDISKFIQPGPRGPG